MGAASPTRFLNSVTRPVAVLDFKEAVDAICRPQFPSASWAMARPPILAISGGVDSMALAYLFSEMQKTFPGRRIGSYPTSVACAVTVDHNLRPESEEEADAVRRSCRALGLKAMVRSITWKDLRKRGLEPTDLSNVESVARRLRYWWLGLTCRAFKSPFLFTAHHSDDQYETLLMRLLLGHGYRGLQGISAANDIPETHGVYGVHKSGLLLDQKGPHPSISFRPTNRETRRLRNILSDDKAADGVEFIRNWESLDLIHFHHDIPPAQEPVAPYLTPLHTEDGGVRVYRPLLEFSKDRLRATCEANKIAWFEDATNQDETMTMRNAVRHLVRNNNTLPAALQKPAILAIGRRSQRRSGLEEAEARRMLTRGASANSFDPCAGTLIVDLPSFRTGPRSRLYGRARREARRPHQRVIAALVVRNLMDFVTPSKNLPAVSALGNVVNQLFPELDAEPSTRTPPSAFSSSGVLFEPIARPGSTRWLLSRAPYKSTEPVRDIIVDWRSHSSNHAAQQEAASIPDDDPLLEVQAERSHGWRRMVRPKLWDGRYWISLASCVSERFHIRPYQADHARAFRASLAPKQRARLEALLKHYAPGKVRTTLPALYGAQTRDPAERVLHLKMLALPTLGIQLDGLDRWVKYDISYRKVDTALLGLRKRGASRALAGYRATSGISRQRRMRRLRMRHL